MVVAGLSTWYIAETGADHLVADDYYKEGLAINRELGKQQLARDLGIEAELDIADGYVAVQLVDENQPSALLLHMSHPMDAGQDFELKLAQRRTGLYEAPWPASSSRRWIWHLEPIGSQADALWRVDGELALPPADAH